MAKWQLKKFSSLVILCILNLKKYNMGLFRKDTKLERKNKAQRILLKSGWIEKYYYIIKVIKSCDSSNNVQSVMKARKWGLDILRRDFDLISDILPRINSWGS